MQKKISTKYIPLEEGYRPDGTVNTQYPPQGGSGVPSKPAPAKPAPIQSNKLSS